MYYFIINPNSRSGRGINIWNFVQSQLDSLQIQYQYFFTKHKGHAIKIATYLCNSIPGPKEFVVLGGDGTMNEVIRGITKFDEICLSYIPSGSSNDFARSLHISSDPKEALATVLAPYKQVQVDIGELETLDTNGQVVSNHRFAVSCGIGYDATICYEALNSKLKMSLTGSA